MRFHKCPWKEWFYALRLESKDESIISIDTQPHRRRPKHSSRASLGSHFGHDQPDPCRSMARSYYPSAGSYTGGFPSKKDILNAAAGCWGDRVHIILGRSWKLVYTIHPIFPLNVVARMVRIFPLFTYGAKFKQIEMPTGRSTTRRKRHPKCTFWFAVFFFSSLEISETIDKSLPASVWFRFPDEGYVFQFWLIFRNERITIDLHCALCLANIDSHWFSGIKPTTVLVWRLFLVSNRWNDNCYWCLIKMVLNMEQRGQGRFLKGIYCIDLTITLFTEPHRWFCIIYKTSY